MPWRRLCTGFFNPAVAVFAVTASSCSDGRCPLGAWRKTGHARTQLARGLAMTTLTKTGSTPAGEASTKRSVDRARP